MLELKALAASLLPAAVALDQQVLGGLWPLEGYRQELERSSSALVGLTPVPQHRAMDATIDSTLRPCSSTTALPVLLGMGCLWSILDEAHITLLVVHPDYQRQGLGRTLLVALLQVAQKRGLARATLEVRTSNQAARSLYQQLGFEVAGHRRGYYTDTGEDALILWRGGLQTPAFAETLNHWQHHNQTRLQQAGWPPVKGAWSDG